MLRLVQRLLALGAAHTGLGVRAVLFGAVAVTGGEPLQPHAGLLGLCATAAAEYPRWTVGCVDADTGRPRAVGRAPLPRTRRRPADRAARRAAPAAHPGGRPADRRRTALARGRRVRDPRRSGRPRPHPRPPPGPHPPGPAGADRPPRPGPGDRRGARGDRRTRRRGRVLAGRRRRSGTARQGGGRRPGPLRHPERRRARRPRPA